MRPPRRAAAIVTLALLSWVAPLHALAQVGRPEVDRQAIVFLVDRVSFEELLSVPQVRALARAGGAALMSAPPVAGDPGAGAYVTIGAGARSTAPEAMVHAFDRQEEVDGRPVGELLQDRFEAVDLPVGPYLLGIDAYVEANEGSIPGLLGRALWDAGRSVAVYGNSDSDVGRDRPAVAIAMDTEGDRAVGRVGLAFVPRPGGGIPLEFPIARRAEDLLGGYRTDADIVSFVALGNRAPNPSPFLTAHLSVFDMGDTLRIDRGSERVPLARVERERREALAEIGERIESLVSRAATHDLLVVVTAATASRQMDVAKDEVVPVVMARGDPAELFAASGPLGSLTSDSTRRLGVVSSVDIAPTVLRFFRLFPPAEMEGDAMRVVAEPAPFELHERHLANRAMSVPVQTAAGTYVTLVGLLALAVLAAGRARRLALAMAVLVLSVPALATALLLAGHLPELRYATVVPFVVAATLVPTLLAMASARRDALLPPALLGAAVLVAFAAEAIVDWRAALTPFIGGSHLDGARFYGLPNAFIGLLVGSSLYVASRWRPVPGTLVVAATALLAGLPSAGANVGAATALFAAAGLWLGVRTQGRLGARSLAIAAAVVVAGLGLVVAGHALASDAPTHATRFVRGSGGGIVGLLEAFVRRLEIGWRLIVRNPFALIPVVGLVVTLVVALRPPTFLREVLERHPAWRDAIVVTLLASVVAYVANDTGPAAAGLGFALGLGGLLYVSLADRAWKMGVA